MISFNHYDHTVRENMGAVRVQVKLTNAVDEELVNRGLLNPTLLRVCEIQALVDTGATRTVLPSSIVQQLGLRIRGQEIAQYADGRQEVVGLTGPVVIELLGRETIEAAMVTGDEVLIGQTVLETLDLLVDCKSQRLISNPAHPEQPVLRV
ncbi:retroviral-like aspartic protease family protein [Synechocystis sp. PCC 7509]|uniref:retroviral-like aspartic protease family protein n=1 Tax=Synechocystis sp. PCC 7509 TaxID=927677 RepID=UPI0002ACC7F4|nr:retroviral-like aspartic protease family protein [Synechocystis sp. PCC 7509]